jgi:putative transcriptional regulator
MESLRGRLLVASPHLIDPNFYRSVVLMVQHDESGAFGLILNRPTGKTIKDVWKLVSDEPCECESPIFQGGPVRGPLAAIHRYEEQSDIEVLPELHYTVEDKALSELLQKEASSHRIFIGYSGWGPGQLEKELEAGGWFTTAASLEDIFSEPHDVWQIVSRRIGREFLAATVKPRVVPDDPSVN